MKDKTPHRRLENKRAEERAARAVKVFRSMLPTLNGYARALTGEPRVRIELSDTPGGRTDGNTIYVRPPLALGDDRSHDRASCDRRDENRQLVCKACDAREKTLIIIYHEIAHIAYNSFQPVSEFDRLNLTRKALLASSTKYADAIRKKVEVLASHETRTYLGMANVISPFLPLILNALEDARVNHQMTLARPGTHTMFAAQAWDVFVNGRETSSGQIELWSDSPRNMQIIIGMFAKASGHEYAEWFAPDIVASLADPELSAIIDEVTAARSPGDVYGISFRALLRLRKLGYCVSDTDPDPDEEEEEEHVEEESSPEELPGEAEGAEGSGDDESPERADEGEGDGDGLTAPDAGDGSTSGTGSGPGEAPGDSKESDGESGIEPEDGSPGGQGQEGDGEAPDSGAELDQGAGSDDDLGSDESQDGEDEADRAGDRPGAGSNDSGEGDATGGSGSSEGEVDESDGTGEAGTGEGDVSLDDDRSGDDLGGGADGAESVPAEGESLDEGGESVNEDLSDAGAERAPDASDHGDSPWDDDSPESDDSGSSGATEGVDAQASEATDGDPSEGSSLDESDAQEGRDGASAGETDTGSPAPFSPDYGAADDVAGPLGTWLGHDDLEHKETRAERRALSVAVEQAEHFDTPSHSITGVNECFFEKRKSRDNDPWMYSESKGRGGTEMLGIGVPLDVPESVLGPALMRMRVAFSANARGRDLVNLKSGKVNGRVLGKRVFGSDERLFKKRVLPGKRDYFVLIGMDVSGSALGENIRLEKRAVMAQAELLSRMGIKFAIYAHTGVWSPAEDSLRLCIAEIKAPDEHWTAKEKNRLDKVHAFQANLDGHTLEYYRKKLDAVKATDKIIMYYTDGQMPAENYDEELHILRREIAVCKKKGYTLLAVGINADDPLKYGLDTVRVSNDADILGVVKHLEGRLLSM